MDFCAHNNENQLPNFSGRIIGQYQVDFLLGKGAFSSVYQGKNLKTNEFVALKFVSRELLKDKQMLAHFEKELRIYSRLDHPNIAKCYDVIYKDEFIIIVMEIIQGGTLSDYIYNGAQTSRQLFSKVGKETLSALSYLHSFGISHNDIKPGNIGIDINMHAKLFDFGLSSDNAAKTDMPCGTPPYIAPEVISSSYYDGRKADIYSFGITMYALLTHSLPSLPNDLCGALADVHTIMQQVQLQYGSQLTEFFNLCLNPDPNLRPSANDLMMLDVFKVDNANDVKQSFSTPQFSIRINKPKQILISKPLKDQKRISRLILPKVLFKPKVLN